MKRSCILDTFLTELIYFMIFFRQAVGLATRENKEFEHLCVYVAQDCAGILYLVARIIYHRDLYNYILFTQKIVPESCV